MEIDTKEYNKPGWNMKGVTETSRFRCRSIAEARIISIISFLDLATLQINNSYKYSCVKGITLFNGGFSFLLISCC